MEISCITIIPCYEPSNDFTLFPANWVSFLFVLLPTLSFPVTLSTSHRIILKSLCKVLFIYIIISFHLSFLFVGLRWQILCQPSTELLCCYSNRGNNHALATWKMLQEGVGFGKQGQRTEETRMTWLWLLGLPTGQVTSPKTSFLVTYHLCPLAPENIA